MAKEGNVLPGGVQADSYGGLYDKLEEAENYTPIRSNSKPKKKVWKKGVMAPSRFSQFFKDFKRGVKKPTSTGGGGGQPIQTTANTGLASQTQQVDEQGDPILYGDANLDAYQRTYDKLRLMDPSEEFQYDKSYAPDKEGFRDVPGYLMDAGKATLAAFGATEKLSKYNPSSDFKTMISESRDRRNLGLTQEARSSMANRMERVYNYDQKNIRNLSGGSGATALANMGGASQRFYDSQNQLNALDESLKMQNRGQYYNAALAGEQVNRQMFDDERQIELMNKQAAGSLLADSMDNIKHRKEYEDTYLNPESPYYQYKKEMVLDTRLNRALKEEAHKVRKTEADKFLLGVQNEMQEKIEGINTAKKGVINDFNQEAIKNGFSPEVNNAEDFKNYNGNPILDITANSADAPVIPGLASPVQSQMSKNEFGMTETQMNDMSDKDLADKGIDRQTHTVIMKDANGNELPPVSYNTYGLAQPMGDAQPKSMNDQEFLDLEDGVNMAYAEEEKNLLDTWFIKDEKKYNKLKKELDERKKAELKAKQDQYLK